MTRINRTQRVVILIGLLVIILMGAFPPWLGRFVETEKERVGPAGYHWLLAPPAYTERWYDPGHGLSHRAPMRLIQIHTGQLCAQLAVAAALTTVLVLALRSRKKPQPSDYA